MRKFPLSKLALSILVAAIAGCGQSVAPTGGESAGEAGQPAIYIHPTVEGAAAARAQTGVVGDARSTATTGSNLYYHGGTGGYGVESSPTSTKVYLVYWGSQWNNNDPSGEAAIQQKFFNGAGGSSWANSVTQYCQGVASGTTFCTGLAGAVYATNNAVIGGIWYDNASAAPSSPRQAQLAAEAVLAAAHFGNTAAGSNNTTQYIINTATGNSSRGFKTQYCAWHSSTTSSYGNIAYTNFPYITDAGASCGAGFVNSPGTTDGITIVGGHEYAETATDIFPNGGWLDSGGAENGDKCAWIASGQGASANVTFSTGTFPVQSLWSNAFNGGAGGCVLAY